MLLFSSSRQYGALLITLPSRLLPYHVFTQSSTKMLHICTRIFAHICKEGFCRPQEEEETQDGEGGATEFQDDVEGTGMGAGQGKNDVADQIEDEEQVLGLKGDEEQPQPEQGVQEEKEGGMEMQVTCSCWLCSCVTVLVPSAA
jgi:midasin